MKILGAGMSGLLAGQHFRTLNPKILEIQDKLPNNHAALLRFKTNSIEQETKIRLKKVQVSKMINYKEDHFTESNLFFNNLYSRKVSGRTTSRSIGNLEKCTRYIAPKDFVSRLSSGLNILYGVDVYNIVREQLSDSYRSRKELDPIVSTIPMKVLASMIDYKIDFELASVSITVFSFELDDTYDIYQTVYYPNPDLPFYRISITGKRVIVEFGDRIEIEDYCDWDSERKIKENIIHFLEIDFGISIIRIDRLKKKTQEYGKLINCDDYERKKFIGFVTQKYNIYSLGRWATHRQILMDDVIDDLKVIDNMVYSNQYNR